MLSIHIPFISNHTDHPFLKYRYFKIWTTTWISKESMLRSWFKLKFTWWVQYHQLTSLLFHVNCPSHSLNMLHVFQIWPRKSKVKFMGKVQGGSDIVLAHISFTPHHITPQHQPSHSWDSYFKIWPWKSRVKVIVQGNIVDPSSYWLTSLSFHVNGLSHFWDELISKFSKVSVMGEKVKGYRVGPTSYQLTSLLFHDNRPSHNYFEILPWKSNVKFIVHSHIVGPTSYRLMSLSFHVNWPTHSWDMVI